MKNLSSTHKLIGVSIIAALAILAASAAFEGSAQTITFIIIAIWWIPFMWWSQKGSTDNKD